MKKLVLILFLFGCTKPDILPQEEITKFVENQEVVGSPSTNVFDIDALGGLLFDNVNKFNNKPYGTLIVNKSNGHPVFDGEKSTRFEVRSGDCGWIETFSDCATDRSRSELTELNATVETGKTVSYTERVYIPSQTRFKPQGGNLLVLTQIRVNDTTQSTISALAYLVMENNNTLLIRTHRQFTWDWNKNYTITNTPYDKWIKIKYEVVASEKSDGYIRVYVEDKLLFEENRQTLVTKDSNLFFKFGIYNSFMKDAKESFGTQVVYFDGLEKKIK